MGCTSLCAFKKTTRRAKTRITKTRRAKTRITKTRRAKTRRAKNKKSKNKKSKNKFRFATPHKEKISKSLKTLDETELGEFDDDFTWSAMLLASQGKQINQISIDEIDWLTKLRRIRRNTKRFCY